MKLTIVLVLAAAIFTSQTANAFDSPRVMYTKMQGTLYEHDKELISWYTNGIRGLWFGFFRGFFHDMRKPAP